MSEECPKCGETEMVSECCGAASFKLQDYGLCRRCRDHCVYVLACGGPDECQDEDAV